MTVQILTGDCRELLATLPDASVQCCVTSPPYHGLRDYGTAAWEGGDPNCDHVRLSPERINALTRNSTLSTPSSDNHEYHRGQYRDRCGKCGAVRIDKGIGLEPTIAEHIDALVQVFREVRRVLHPTGTVWLNYGDAYNSGPAAGYRPGSSRADGVLDGRSIRNRNGTHADGLKPKDLIGLPWRLAFALQADGWWLRSAIVWHKPNPMPESVTDRPTSAYEHIFLLTKNARYYYDADAIREDAQYGFSVATNGSMWSKVGGSSENPERGNYTVKPGSGGSRNARNVWTIPTQGFSEAHFAVFPPEIPRRCILAGTSEKGQCPACGAPWVRVVQLADRVSTRPGNPMKNDGSRNDSDTRNQRFVSTYSTTGWQPSCPCDAGDPVPQTVLDLFSGAGTTLLVADRLGRHGIGIEVNPDYVQMAQKRIRNDAPLFAEVETA